MNEKLKKQILRNGEYWKDRFIQLEKSLYNESIEYFNELEAQYNKAIQSVENDIMRWYVRLAENNDITMQEAKKLLTRNELEEFRWLVGEYIKYGKENAVNQQWMKQLENASARVHISRLEALKIQMQNHVEVLMGNELDGVSNLIKNTYTEGYYRTIFEIQKGFGIGSSFMILDKQLIEQVLSKPWTSDGTNFSKRIWGQYRPQLAYELHQQLTQAVMRGDNPKKCITAIARRFEVSRSKAENLVMTESAFFRSAAQRQGFKNLNVKKYDLCATLDGKTSKICRDIDGKIVDLCDYEVGVTAPPFHGRCRTVMCPHYDDEFTQGEMRAARDENGKTYYVPADMKYPTWFKEHVS